MKSSVGVREQQRPRGEPLAQAVFSSAGPAGRSVVGWPSYPFSIHFDQYAELNVLENQILGLKHSVLCCILTTRDPFFVDARQIPRTIFLFHIV